MAFAYVCTKCSWSSRALSGADLGVTPSSHVCTSCGHEDFDGPLPEFTMKEFFSGSIKCRAEGCDGEAISVTIKVGNGSSFRNAQLSEKERPVVWENPNDPDPKTRYRYPATYNPVSNPEMPQKFKDRGFQKKEFYSLREHEKFQKETDTVNHKTWDITASRNHRIS